MKQRLCAQIKQIYNGEHITIPMYKHIDTDAIVARLEKLSAGDETASQNNVIHLDIAHEVNIDDIILQFRWRSFA